MVAMLLMPLLATAACAALSALSALPACASRSRWSSRPGWSFASGNESLRGCWNGIGRCSSGCRVRVVSVHEVEHENGDDGQTADDPPLVLAKSIGLFAADLLVVVWHLSTARVWV